MALIVVSWDIRKILLSLISRCRYSYLHTSGVVANGKVHWLGSYRQEPCVLVSTDLSEDVLQEISNLSFSASPADPEKITLFENGGGLSFFRQTHQYSSTLELWSMRDWNAMNHWEKKYVVVIGSLLPAHNMIYAFDVGCSQ
ncbi:hypothetical protein Droror1_Dr00000503 [Drosera rotundifolia]